jgi:hypothetical protein
MDGCGSWRDNVLVGRLWRLRAYDSVAEARCGVAAARTNYPLHYQTEVCRPVTDQVAE